MAAGLAHPSLRRGGQLQTFGLRGSQGPVGDASCFPKMGGKRLCSCLAYFRHLRTQMQEHEPHGGVTASLKSLAVSSELRQDAGPENDSSWLTKSSRKRRVGHGCWSPHHQKAERRHGRDIQAWGQALSLGSMGREWAFQHVGFGRYGNI